MSGENMNGACVHVHAILAPPQSQNAGALPAVYQQTEIVGKG